MPKGWKLWYGETTPETVQAASGCEFHRIGANVTLCFARKKDVQGMRPANDAILQRMHPEDHRWLKESMDTVLARYAQRNKAAIRENNRAFLLRFADELKAEQQRLDEQEVSGHGK